jgi:predicted dehydrogenase
MLRWGILGAAKIAKNRVIPAIQSSKSGRVTAIATRNPKGIESFCEETGIGLIFDDYDALIASTEIDAVYIPLPNHLHVPFAIKAAKAGKHVLCEKPISMDSRELMTLIEVQKNTGVLIQEAFMVMSNPLWAKAKAMIDGGEIGDLRTLTGNFSYLNLDPSNVRNVPEYGGGALMDIGCYLTLAALYFFDQKPTNAEGYQLMDPEFGVDYLTSAAIEFPKGHAIITCSTQSMPQQSLILEGTKGRIQFEVPFSHPDDQPGSLILDRGPDIFRIETTRIVTEPFNHYRKHVDHFAEIVSGDKTNQFDLQFSLLNMQLIDMLRR